jgi:hypothetical protein
MRNGSLLIELSGVYHNPEFRFFQHFANMFGVYYSRISTAGLEDHKQPSVNVSTSEVGEIIDTIKNYFDLKPFVFNSK